jgi:BASS family bile acid:Na+ symporter
VTEFFESLSKVAVLVFVVTCMVTAGLGLGVRAVAAQFRRWRLMGLAAVANFVVAPAAAYALAAVLPLDPQHATGLLLLGGAAGAPFLPKLAELAKGDRAFSVGLMLVLMAGSVAFMPVALPLMIPGLDADPWPLLRPLLLTMLLPLAGGMALKGWSERWAGRVQAVTGPMSNVSMLLAVALLIGLNVGPLAGTFGTGAVAVGVGYVAVMLTVGCLLGGPAAGTRSVLGLGTGQRNVAAALLIATQNYPDQPGVVVMLLVTTLAGLIPLLVAARWLARRPRAEATPPAPVPEEAPR